MKYTESDLKSVIAYIESADIPQVAEEVMLEGVAPESASSLPTFLDYELQTVAVGNTVAEIAKNIDADLRSSITNSLLLAHLTTKKKLGANATQKEWLTHYVDALTNLKWLPSEPIELRESYKGTTVEVSEELIRVLGLLLGGTVALTATSIIIELLKGINENNKTKPWFTLFDRETRSTTSNIFQLGHVYLNQQGDPEIALVAIELTAEKDAFQILFFKTSTESASLDYTSNKARTNSALVLDYAEDLDNILKKHTRSYIANVEI